MFVSVCVNVCVAICLSVRMLECRSLPAFLVAERGVEKAPIGSILAQTDYKLKVGGGGGNLLHKKRFLTGTSLSHYPLLIMTLLG